MKIINIYRYENDNELTYTPIQRHEDDPIEMFRLIADEGKILNNGQEKRVSIDTYTIDEWVEEEGDE